MKATRRTTWQQKLTPEQRERKNLQARNRNEWKRANKKTHTQTVAPMESVAEQPLTVPHVPTDPKRDAQWQGCCKALFNQRHRPDDWEQLQVVLLEQVDDQRLPSAALALVAGIVAAGVSRWDWLPAPTDDELADTKAWAAQRLADRSREQDRAEDARRLRQKVARAFGQPTSGGTGTPGYLQRSKFSLEQLGRRLRWTKDAHEGAGREFRREFLDHRSPHFIKVRNGGISNKQVVIMAGEITGQRQQRSFDDVWNIVTGWLSEQQPEEDSDNADH